MHKNINHFRVIGISHHLADVEEREQLNLTSENIKLIHEHLAEQCRGGFVLATCNRTEIYFVANDSQTVVELWAKLANTSIQSLKNNLYQYQGKSAIEFLFRVGSGLDSQILGDFQIIGQIKQAYKQSIIDGAENKKITRLLDMLLKTSKRVKNETALSTGISSVAYAAIQHLAILIDEDWKNGSAFVYGAGKMGSSIVRKLAELMPPGQVMVANRTAQKAIDLSQKYGVLNVSDKEMKSVINECDFLISTAAAEKPIFNAELLENVDLNGKIMIDLSMPRSISSELENMGAKVVNLDYLQDIQNDTFEKRKQAIPLAEKIVKEELTEYFEWIRSRDIAPTLHALKEKLNTIKEVELKRIKKKESELDEDQINRVAEALINKVATQCVKHVKRNNGDSIDLIHEIFELENIN